MSTGKQLKWLPVASFAALLFTLFCAGSLISLVVGTALIVAIMTMYGFFAAVFEDHHLHLRAYWFDGISPIVHWVLIVVWALFTGAIVTLLLLQYQLKVILVKRGATLPCNL